MAQQPQPAHSGFINPDNYDIYYEYFGRGEREVVALLNGLTMTTEDWHDSLPELLDEFDVLLFDFPGQGRSSKPDASYSITRIADYLSLVMDHLEIQKVHSVGVSWGGFVAIEHARLYGSRLHTVTLSGAIASHEVLFDMYEALSLRFFRGGPELFGLYTHYLYERLFGEGFVRRVGLDRIEAMRRRLEERYRDQTHLLLRLTKAQREFFSSLEARVEEYRAVDTPVLVMPGEEDRLISPRVQRKLLDVFPRTRWLPIPEAGHLAFRERADVFFASLKAFMEAKAPQFPSLLTSA